MAGLANHKLTGPKNAEYQAILGAWDARVGERKAAKKRNKEYGKALRDYFEKHRDDFQRDKQLIMDCLASYSEISEDLEDARKLNKVLNNFLRDMSLGHSLPVTLDGLRTGAARPSDRLQR